MSLEKPYVKRTAVDGETIPPSDHNKQEDQLEALTVLANRSWTTAGRPTPGAGDLYPTGFNTELVAKESWNGTDWVQGGGIWQELAHVIIAGSAEQNLDISGLSIGPTGTHKRFWLSYNVVFYCGRVGRHFEKVKHIL